MATRSPLPTDPETWEGGACVPPYWKVYVCCTAPEGFDCSDVPIDAPRPERSAEECALRESSEFASELSPTDGCTAVFDCGGTTLRVECDGENDGTGTSGCMCEFGSTRHSYSSLVEAEGRGACEMGGPLCFAEGTSR